MSSLLPGFCAACLAGCATGRDILDVRVDIPSNPDTSQAFVITNVIDNRTFEESPSSRDVPSLRDADVSSVDATSRAIARKGNTFGAPMGDIVLPEGRTVSDVVGDALIAALREQGYAVYPIGSRGAEDADSIEVEVEEFWAWFEPGFARLTLAFSGDVVLMPNPVTKSGIMRIHADTEIHGQVATLNSWLEIFQAGLRALMDDLKAQMGRASS